MDDESKKLVFERVVKFDSTAISQLHELQQYGQFNSLTHVLQSALGFLDWARERHAQGMRFYAIDPKTGVRVEVYPFPELDPMPTLSIKPQRRGLLGWLERWL